MLRTRAETEQISAVRVVECTGCCVGEHRAAVGGGIRLLAGVDLQGLELEAMVMDESVWHIGCGGRALTDGVERSDLGGKPGTDFGDS